MANDRKNHFFSIDKDNNTKGSQVQDTYIQEVEIQRQIRRYPKLEARNPKPQTRNSTSQTQHPKT